MRIKFIKPSYEIDMLGQTGIEKLKHIEKCSRTCYRSEDKITDVSYKALVSMLVKNGHHAMLEFMTIYFKINLDEIFTLDRVLKDIMEIQQKTVGLNFTSIHNAVIISMNARTLYDAKSRVNNDVANLLLIEANKQWPILYETISNK